MSIYAACQGNMIVILVIGVPGSGKTIFSKQLKEEYDKKYLTKSEIISFDDAKFNVDWDENSFQTIRKQAVDNLSYHVQSEKCNRLATSIDDNTIPIKNHNLIIIDDIMYLRSMRREIYVLLRDLSISLLTIHIKTSIEHCLERNSNREGIQRIPEEIISNIYNHFEPPDPYNIFDRYCFIFDNNNYIQSMGSTIEWILVTTDNLNKQSSMEHIVIKTNIVTQHINKESFNKELDNELRNISSIFMKQIITSSLYNTKEVKEIGKNLSVMRLHFLQQTKSIPIKASGADYNDTNNVKVSEINRYSQCFISQLIAKFPNIPINSICELNNNLDK